MTSLGKLPRFLLVGLLAVLAGFPVYWMATTALSDQDQLYVGRQVPWPQLGNLGSLLAAIREVPAGRWMVNSLVIAAGTTVVSLLLGSLAGYALSRFRFRGRGLVGFLLFMTQVVPEALILVPLYAMFITLGLLNDLAGLALANAAFSLPVATFIIKGAIDTVPYEIEESALVDNCPRFGILCMIVLPLVAPSLAAAAVIAFFAGWNEYLFASTFLMNRELWPASVGLASFIGQYETPLSVVMGTALLFSLPAITFFLLIQRRIVSGLTSGAVKG